jgi:hypothetical protein
MIHVQTEMPKVGRRAFAEIVRFREEYPAVASDRLGWGIEPPALGPTGVYGTLLHAEIAPALIAFDERCADRGSRLNAAWSAYTAAAALAGVASPHRFAAVLWLTPDFIGIARFGGGRPAFKGWTGALSEGDWAEVRGLLADCGVGLSGAPVGPDRRRGRLAVIAAGEPAAQAAFWAELAAAGVADTVFSLDDVGRAVARLRRAHPANLAEAFPRPLPLNRGLAAVAGLAFATAVILTALARRDKDSRFAARSSAQAEEAALDRQIEKLTANEREIAQLRDRSAGEAVGWPRDRYAALVALAAATPDAVALAAFHLQGRGEFRLEAQLLDPKFAVEEFQAAMERAGFGFGSGQRLAVDAASGRVTGQGTFQPKSRW